MAGKIIIDTDRCKGCGLCVIFCAKNGLSISKKSNIKGFFPAEFKSDNCTGCGNCAIMCPEAVIEVRQDDNIVTIETAKRKKSALPEKATSAGQGKK